MCVYNIGGFSASSRENLLQRYMFAIKTQAFKIMKRTGVITDQKIFVNYVFFKSF